MATGEQRGGSFNDAVAPLQLNRVILPGDAEITSNFAISPDGGSVTFGTMLTGAFERTVPNGLTGPHESGTRVVGGSGGGAFLQFFPTQRRPVCGGPVRTRSEQSVLHPPASASAMISSGPTRGTAMTGHSGTKPTSGHRDLFFRVSRQIAQGSQNGIIQSAEGTAIGFTARRSFDLSKGMRVDAALNLDKFAGGEAKTVFGNVRMDESDWNRTLSVHFVHQPSSHAVFTAGAEVFSPAQGEDVFIAGVKLNVQFQPAARHGHFLTSGAASHRESGDTLGAGAADVFR